MTESIAIESQNVSDNLIARNEMFREKIVQFESELAATEGAKLGDNEYCPLKHSFGDGVYVRELLHPKGILTVTKIHKLSHPFFLLSGEMSMATEEGVRRIKAPFYAITKAGTKRVIYAHEDCIVVTVHVTNETDLEKIEEEIISPCYEDFDKERMVLCPG